MQPEVRFDPFQSRLYIVSRNQKPRSGKADCKIQHIPDGADRIFAQNWVSGDAGSVPGDVSFICKQVLINRTAYMIQHPKEIAETAL